VTADQTQVILELNAEIAHLKEENAFLRSNGERLVAADVCRFDRLRQQNDRIVELVCEMGDIKKRLWLQDKRVAFQETQVELLVGILLDVFGRYKVTEEDIKEYGWMT
jgi:glutaredoxin-related protein